MSLKTEGKILKIVEECNYADWVIIDLSKVRRERGDSAWLRAMDEEERFKLRHV